MAGFAASAYRAAQHESTGFTPNRMVLGRENAIPLDILYGKSLETPKCTTEYIQWLTDTLMFAYKEARTRLDGKLRTQKSYYDRRIKARMFEIGDKVLWLRPRVRKMENVWKGP